MKGGRTAPRNGRCRIIRSLGSCCFNEGGADCPPKLAVINLGVKLFSCFNEGGADCPPKLSPPHHLPT